MFIVSEEKVLSQDCNYPLHVHEYVLISPEGRNLELLHEFKDFIDRKGKHKSERVHLDTTSHFPSFQKKLLCISVELAASKLCPLRSH